MGIRGVNANQAPSDNAAFPPAVPSRNGLLSFLRWNLFQRPAASSHTSSAPDRTTRPRLPIIIGQWRVLDVIGEGTTSRVFRVVPTRKTACDTAYALKLQNAAQARDSNARNRFLRESRIMKSISHRNIVRLVEAGEHEGCPYLVMEMIEGISLREAMQENQPKLKGKLDWAIQICRGLAAMHERGVVHRDLKPENILTTRVGFIKLADFGLAKTSETSALTKAGHLVGTPAYISPEYLLGAEPDLRSDLYSLGVILYELFTGAMPFRAQTVSEFIQAHLEATPIRPRRIVPDIPLRLEHLILRLLEKSPERRYGSAVDVRQCLEAVLADAAGVSPSFRHVA